MTPEEIKSAVRDTIAAQILEGLDTETRDALLQEAIVKTIGSWEIRSEIRDVIAEKARERAAEIMATDAYAKKLARAVKQGCEDCLKTLRASTCEAVSELFVGPDYSGHEHHRSMIGKHMQRKLNAAAKEA